MRFKTFKIGKPKDENIIEEEVEIPEPAGNPAAEPVNAAQPHGPLSELELEDKPIIDDDEMGDFGDAFATEDGAGEDDDITIVQVKASEVAGNPPVEPEKEKEPDVANDDSLSSLFNTDEEEFNPLASLIASLPDVTPQELLDDIQEIKEIIQEWRHH